MGIGEFRALSWIYSSWIRYRKDSALNHDEARRLKAVGLAAGRYPNLMVAGLIAKATGTPGQHIRDRGFSQQYYLDLVPTHGPVSRKDVDGVLIPKLPDRLTEKRKQNRVHHLLQALRYANRIANHGTRSRPAWVLVETSCD